ncbi:MAG: hypothetical protein R3C45_05225 [Phycisphaerales bacterium]
MKPYHVISAVTAVILLGLAVLLYGQADGPTSATSAQALALQSFSADLPALAQPGDPNTDAAVFYERAIALYAENSDALPRTRKHDELVDGLCELLLQAATSGIAGDGFMDGHIPVAIGAQPDYGDALENIYENVIVRAAELYARGDTAGARDLALAVWLFGQRLFEHNTLYYHRVVGLDMMESAGSILFEMAAKDGSPDPAALRTWSAAIKQIRSAWQPKLEIVMGIDPHPGDLVNIALNDQDRTFRVEATLRLGIHRYQADRGNRRAMQRAIAAAIASDDPMISQAGRAADALTLEEKRRLY